MVHLQIRPARETDAQAISALIFGLSRYFVSDPDSPEIKPFLETLTPSATAERIASEDYSCFVAESQSGVCGVVALKGNSHVYHLFVQSDAHRQGVARALWEHVRAQSAAAVFTVNSSLFAVPVYERLGFRSVDSPQRKDGLEFVPMEYRNDG